MLPLSRLFTLKKENTTLQFSVSKTNGCNVQEAGAAPSEIQLFILRWLLSRYRVVLFPAVLSHPFTRCFFMFHIVINQTVDTLPSGHTPGVFEGVNHRISARFRLFQSSASSHPERNSEPCWFPPISAADIFILCSCHIFDTAAGHQLCSSGKSDLVSPSGPCWCGPPWSGADGPTGALA